MPEERAYALAREEGEFFNLFGGRVTPRAGKKQTDGLYTLFENNAAGQVRPPPHMHHNMDEAWYILDGAATVSAGSRRFAVEPGSFTWLPRKVPHTLEIVGHIRAIVICFPGGNEDFVRAVSAPTGPDGKLEVVFPEIDVMVKAVADHAVENLEFEDLEREWEREHTAYLLTGDEASGETHEYLGATVRMLADSETTNDQATIFEISGSRGAIEMPRHVHEGIDEGWFVIEGQAACSVGERTFDIGPRGFALLPKGEPHQLEILSDEIRMLVVATPGGHEQHIARVAAGEEPAAVLTSA